MEGDRTAELYFTWRAQVSLQAMSHATGSLCESLFVAGGFFPLHLYLQRLDNVYLYIAGRLTEPVFSFISPSIPPRPRPSVFSDMHLYLRGWQDFLLLHTSNDSDGWIPHCLGVNLSCLQLSKLKGPVEEAVCPAVIAAYSSVTWNLRQFHSDIRLFHTDWRIDTFCILGEVFLMHLPL